MSNQESNNQKKAIDDIAKALETAFKKYTLSTRRNAWSKVKSQEGNKAVNKIILDPSREVKGLFEPITFKKFVNKGR
jgi:hypothetical protein